MYLPLPRVCMCRESLLDIFDTIMRTNVHFFLLFSVVIVHFCIFGKESMKTQFDTFILKIFYNSRNSITQKYFFPSDFHFFLCITKYTYMFSVGITPPNSCVKNVLPNWCGLDIRILKNTSLFSQNFSKLNLD